MGKCVQCEGFFPPHFMIDMEKIENPPQKCAYCYLDKSEVTMVNDDTGKEEKVNKKEAQKRYKTFLKKLYESKNVQELLDKQKPLSLNEK